MYEMLLIWFFCVAFSSMAIITLTLTRKLVKQAIEADCVQSEKTGLDWLNSLPNDAFIDLQDETNETETNELEDETPKVTMPVIPRTGKVTMLTENLSKCLNIVKDSVGSRTLPILNKVLIEFKDGIAVFRTTNLDTAIVTSCGCKIESEFSCVLPFKILKELSEFLYDDIVVIEQSNDKLLWNRNSNLNVITLTQGRNVCTLVDDDSQDYPPTPKVEGQSVVISEIGEAIKKVKDKMIQMDSKHWNCGKFAGLYFDLSKPNIVATDGNRMKIATLNCEPKPIQFRIDKDCALILAKFKDMDCLVTAGENQTRFDFGEYMHGSLPPSIYTTVITQNLQGTYPDYEALKESHKEAVSAL